MNKKLFIAQFIKKLFIKKPIILVSDRKTIAGDNGEVFFQYLQTKDVISYFEILSGSPDYDRMKKIGKVVSINSIRHQLLLFFADVYVSSQIEYYPKRQSEIPYIFLQHGVADKDISDYLRPHFESREKGYIIGSTLRERDSFNNPPYIFKDGHVWITGLPRFDKLEHDEKKIIMLSFTWRTHLSWNNECIEDVFLQSDYYKNIKEIFDSKIIKENIEKTGYSLYIKMHPEMVKYEEVIECPPHVKMWKADYNSMFAQSNLLITDCSSIIYDFAYLKKPIVYYQPKENESNQHVWKESGFSYERDGFGEVANNIEQLESILCEYLASDCSLKSKYEKRIENSFVYMDNNNCDRVYEKMIGILKK